MLRERQEVSLDPSIFRAYDIRGVVDKTLTAEGVFLIGKAIGSVAREQGETQLVIARDGRFSGPTLSDSLCNGILSVGCDVIDIGMSPTPLLYYATTLFDTRSGVMLTGSHNPPEYNGLKIVLNGKALTENQIQALYQRIEEQRFSEGKGAHRSVNIEDKFITEITKDIALQKPLNIIVDAGNGVTGEIAPKIFRALGCQVQELFCEIDGNFPNHHADPSQVNNLQDLIRVVREQQADIGLAFDGDGDRLGVITRSGEIIWPDRLLMLFARHLAKPELAKVVFDVKCTSHLAEDVRALGGLPVMWKTGHSHIKAKMAELNAELGGEMSGHFFFRDRWFGFDDALYAGARLLEILAQYQEDSDAIFATIPNSVNTPELKISVPDAEKFQLMQRLIESANFSEAKEVTTIDGLRVNFTQGWGLVRPSNTMPHLILRFEAVNNVILTNIQNLFREWMLSVKPDLVLPF